MAEQTKQEVKRHQIIDDISKQMSGLQLSDTFPIAGRKYLMSTLTLEEEQWVDSYIAMYGRQFGLEYSALRPLAVISAALKEIDGVPVDQLFEFPKEITDDLKQWTVNGQTMRSWYMNQVAYWLSDKRQGAGISAQLVRALVEAYGSLLERREKSWAEIKN